MSPENEKIIDELISDAKKLRGEVISQSIDIEYLLNEIIGLFFFEDRPENLNIFIDSILQKEFFTFGEKMNVLNYLLTNHPERFYNLNNKKRKQIITLIREIIEYRNKFAHQDIIVNFKEKTACIIDKKGNNLLSEKSINDFHDKLKLLSEGLSLLIIIRMCNSDGKSLRDLKKVLDDVVSSK